MIGIGIPGFGIVAGAPAAAFRFGIVPPGFQIVLQMVVASSSSKETKVAMYDMPCTAGSVIASRASTEKPTRPRVVFNALSSAAIL